MNVDQHYDCAVIGGGPAGLALSVLLANKGFKVILFEKERYPFHKVCGEYVSMESYDFLEELGLPLHEWQSPVIRRLMISAGGARRLIQPLPLGGFGVSRYKLDAALAETARRSGVNVWEQTKVYDVKYEASLFYMNTDSGIFTAPVCCGTFGKRSNLDIKWNRTFVNKKGGGLSNYIGVKYHALLHHPRDMIALHSFHHGYCGISAIEENKYCVCYLTTTQNLRSHHNDIKSMEEGVLYKNPYLREIFTTADFLYREPLTISQVSFDKKEQVENHMLMTGDAAGMIAPLCGNGMSMALHGSKIAAELISGFLQGEISRADMEQGYKEQWSRAFHARLRNGRIIQRFFFGHEMLTYILIQAVRPFPPVVRQIIRQTHGSAF